MLDSMKTIDRPKRAIYYIVKGEGVPVILIHGIASSIDGWCNQIPVLSGSGYCVIAIDLPGHGESFKPGYSIEYTFEYLYPFVESWINNLDNRSTYAIVAHSLGATFSLQFALDHPDRISGMVLINPFFYFHQLAPAARLIRYTPSIFEISLRLAPMNVLRMVATINTRNAQTDQIEIRRQTALDYKRAAPQIVRIPPSIPDLNRTIPQLSIPIRVIWGAKDRTLLPDSFPRLVSSLPHSDGFSVPGCGHNPHRLKPEFVNHMIIDFLDQLQ